MTVDKEVKTIRDCVFFVLAAISSMMIYACLAQGNWIGTIAFTFVGYWSVEKITEKGTDNV